MPEIRIDRSKSLAEEPWTGHNRWHPDIPPVIRCDPGEDVILETRDAFDGQFGPDTPPDALAAPNLDVLHPLTGPVYVDGAEPGDLLDVEISDIEPERYGYTAQVPGFGFLRDVFPEPFKVDWDIAGGWATSAALPGVRIPGAPFMGTIGLSPDHEQLPATRARQQALLDGGGALRPSAASAVPGDPHIAASGMRTMPPRAPTGNVDVKQLSRGAHLLVPVDVHGALFSAGDAHFAQGDGETCGRAIEMGATLHVRFTLRKGEAARQGIRRPWFATGDHHGPPPVVAPPRFSATTGSWATRDDGDRSEGVSLAARNALLDMIDCLTERGWTPQEAYAICSVAVDLKLRRLIDVRDMLVSALLPEDIFTDARAGGRPLPP
jgi:formamidase